MKRATKDRRTKAQLLEELERLASPSAGAGRTPRGGRSECADCDDPERRRAEQELARLNRTLRALSNVNQALMRAEGEADFLQAVCRIVVEDCGLTMVWIGYAEDDEARSVRPVASAGFEEGYLESLKISWADTERGRGPTGVAIRTGKVSFCRNMLTDPRFEPWRAAAIQRGYASSIVLPLLSGGKAFGAISIYSREPDPFTGDEVELLSELADDLSHGVTMLRTRAAHRRAEEGLALSEARYRSLFESMTEGFAVHEIVCDGDGVPADYRFLDVNPAFERLTGLRRAEVVGRLKTEVLPDDDPYWIQAYGAVALTGEPARFENYSSALRRHYEVYAYRPAPRHFAVVFTDVTERRESEQAIVARNGVAQILAETGSVGEMAPRVLQHLCETLGWLAGELWLADAGSERLLRASRWQAPGAGLEEPMAPGEPLGLAPGEGVPGRIWAEDRLLSLEDVNQPAGTQSLLGFPVRLGEKSLGVAVFTTMEPRSPDPRLQETMGTIGSQVGQFIQRTRAEAALRASEAKAQNLVRYAPAAIYEVDVNGTRMIQANDVACQWSGYSREELLGMAPLALIDEGSRARFRDRVMRMLAGEHDLGPAEYRILTKDGHDLFVEVNVGASSSEGVVPQSVLVVAHDITARRQAVAALRESEARFRTLTESMPDLVMRFDRDLRLLYANPAVCLRVGRPVEELVGRTASEYGAAPEAAVCWEQAAREVLRSGEARRFEQSSTWGDETRTLDVELVPEKDADGTLRAVIAIGHDVTEAKRARDALRDSEERYRALVELAPEAVLVFQEGRYVYANPAGLRLFGAGEPDRLLGRDALDLVHPADRELMKARMSGLAEGGTAPPGEIRIVRLDGREVLTETTAAPIVFGGRPAGQVIVRDVSERRRFEEHLAHSQKMEALGVLAGGVAHDFNNMLVGVIGNASLAQDMLPSTSPAQPFLERIVKSGEYAAGLTRQLLAYTGKGRMVMEPVDLSQLVGDGLELLRSAIPNRVTVSLDLAEDLPPILADRAQLQQVFMNLAVNAAEAIGTAAGAIMVRTSVVGPAEGNPADGPDEAAPGHQVVLEVRDTGCGMDDETRARIFEPFFTTKFLGRGLGLAAVSGIVRDHEGTIRVASAPGRGSRFTVSFPATEGEAAVEARPRATAGATGRGGTVLLVDDEAVVREMGRAALERQGFEVLVAGSGREAIESFRRESPRVRLVILDLSMPGMSGTDVLPVLREIQPDIPVVLSSGYSEEEVRKLLPDSPALRFIQKPYTTSRLAETVQAALD